MRPVHRSALRTLVSLFLTMQFFLQPLSLFSPAPVFAAPLAVDVCLSVLNDEAPTQSLESEESSANNLDIPTPTPSPGSHQQWTREYENVWTEWIENNRGATQQQVLDFLNELLSGGRFP